MRQSAPLFPRIRFKERLMTQLTDPCPIDRMRSLSSSFEQKTLIEKRYVSAETWNGQGLFYFSPEEGHMPSIKHYRLFITGDPSFNNYVLLNYYMDMLTTPKSILYAESGTTIGRMVECYCSYNNIVCFLVSVDRTDPLAVSVMGKKTDMLVILREKDTEWTSTVTSIYRKMGKDVYSVDLNPSDRILRSDETKLAGTPVSWNETFETFMMDCNDRSPSDYAMIFIERLIRSSEMLEKAIALSSVPVKTENTQGAAALSVLRWIHLNQLDLLTDILTRMNQKDTDELGNRRKEVHKESAGCLWSMNGEQTPVYTATGLMIGTSYSGVLSLDRGTFLEIPDHDLIRKHVHRPFNESEETEEVTQYFHTSEPEAYPIAYRKEEFGSDPFKAGYWYINIKFVTKDKLSKESENARTNPVSNEP